MNVNSGGGLPPIPNNPNANAAPALQQILLVVPPPVISNVTSAVSRPEALVSNQESMEKTEPKLSARDPLSVGVNKRTNHWQLIEQAIALKDIQLVHRMLDQGNQLCLTDEDDPNQAFDVLIPKEIFKHLKDIEVFDRLIQWFTQQGMQTKLYYYTSEVGNGVLLRRLIQTGVEGWKNSERQIQSGVIKAIQAGDSAYLEAYFQILKENCPTCKPNWSKIFSRCLGPDSPFPAPDIMTVLVRHLDVCKLTSYSLARFFRIATETGQDGAVLCLVQWLGEEFDEFIQSDGWKEVQRAFSPHQSLLLAKCGFPPDAIALPLPSDQSAIEFQRALFGATLSKGPFATMLRSPTCSSLEVIHFIHTVAVGTVNFNSSHFESRNHDRKPSDVIAFQLFKQGLAPSLSIKLALALWEHRQSTESRFLSDHRLSFLACLIDCVHPDAFESLDEPVSVEQANAIHEAILEAVTQQLGNPAAFFAASLACVQTNGTIDTKKLALMYGKGMGLPAAIVKQIGTTLQAVSAEVMASTLPPNLLKPGMTGVDLQLAFHHWVRQGVARWMITRLPHELGVNIARRDRADLDKQGSDLHEDDFVTPFEVFASTNYLITSVIRQYGQILAQDIEGSSAVIVETCRTMSVDAFKPPVKIDDSSDEEGSSTSDSESEHSSTSTTDSASEALDDSA